MGLCQDASVNVYVADYYNKRVQVLGPYLVFKEEFKCCGETIGVAIDTLGTLHAATISGLQSFSGNFVRCSMNGLYGDVAVSQEGYLFVSHYLANGGLQIHKPDKSLLRTINGLKSPLGVFLDQSGYIYIVECGANKVCKY